MKIVPLILLLWLFTSCKTQHTAEINTSQKKEITITGIAEHAKMGAIVLTDNGTYYIKNKANWDTEGYFKKKIRVTGYLETQTIDQKDLVNDKGEISQGAVGEIKYIELISCELVK